MPNKKSNQKSSKYDLEERTALFGECVIEFALQLSRSPVNDPLTVQFVKSGTSIGANYCEADAAESKKDFTHKLGICKKESKETKYWLRMIAKANPLIKSDARKLWREAHELLLIFSTIIKKARDNQQ